MKLYIISFYAVMALRMCAFYVSCSAFALYCSSQQKVQMYQVCIVRLLIRTLSGLSLFFVLCVMCVCFFILCMLRRVSLCLCCAFYLWYFSVFFQHCSVFCSTFVQYIQYFQYFSVSKNDEDEGSFSWACARGQQGSYGGGAQAGHHQHQRVI